MQQLPLAADPDDEYALFERVRGVYARAGFAEAQDIALVVDDRSILPSVRAASVVVVRHFVADGPASREHLAAMSHLLYGDRLPPAAAIAFADYRAYMTLLVCHELAHAIASVRGVSHPDHPWSDEQRAIDLERACLGDLVRARAVPADSVEAADRFVRLVLAAAPAGQPVADPAAFEAAYPRVVLGIDRDPDLALAELAEADVVLTMYARYRRERAAAAPMSALADLAGEMAKP
jgi:hypothetical protein